MILMMSLPKMKISCLHPQVHLSSSSLLAATEALPRLRIRSRTSYLVRCGSARRRRLTSYLVGVNEFVYEYGY
ncbi:hypothetical protein BRARA_A01910 [Brassica rapa]|uniref:Uncharacterized protein n=1 Tax=Brassica campestris TaxID=3711 RepID=A0A398AV48_BRACM|nr:hypothetical protein BRARA_A01910 [Brassica rapa]